MLKSHCSHAATAYIHSLPPQTESLTPSTHSDRPVVVVLKISSHSIEYMRSPKFRTPEVKTNALNDVNLVPVLIWKIFQTRTEFKNFLQFTPLLTVLSWCVTGSLQRISSYDMGRYSYFGSSRRSTVSRMNSHRGWNVFYQKWNNSNCQFFFNNFLEIQILIFLLWYLPYGGDSVNAAIVYSLGLRFAHHMEGLIRLQYH